MVWITFLVAAAIVVFAATKLAEYGDIIAVRTNLGGLVVGTVFLAAATSLPELVASISAFQLGEPDLAAGNFFGSNMVNMMLLALVDLSHNQVPLLRKVAVTHALTAGLTTILMLIAIISILADIGLTIGWVGVDSIVIMLAYFGGIWMMQQETKGRGESAVVVEVAPEFPTLRRGAIGFGLMALILVAVVPQLVSASAEIAVITGLGAGFVGTVLLSIVTSLPELVAALAAMRIGAYDLAVGNLFGSSVFNMLGLGMADVFYTKGRLLGDIDPNFALVGLLGLLLINMALIGNLSRVERRIGFVEVDAVAIIAVYLLGLYLLFIRGIGM